MSGPPDDKPERLLAGDATEFERRIMEAVLRQRPPRDATKRMAKALGVAAATVGTATAATTAAGATASGAAVVWPWVSAGVVGLAVAAAVVAPRVARKTGEPRPVARPPVTAPAPRALEPTPPAQPPAVVAEPERRPTAPSPHVRPAAPAGTPAGELREQVALLDSARGAMSAGASGRALGHLRRYLDRYPAGTFRPEAIALEVEALMKLGRDAEARALAQRFIADHPGSLLARRVADVAGLEER